MARTIVLAEFKHETNSFSTALTGLETFRARNLLLGKDIEPHFKGTATEVGGFLDGCAKEGLTPVPVVAANAIPGGKVTREAFNYMRDALLSGLRETKPDGVLLALHGAMVAEDAPDGEGELLLAVRQLVGPDIPVICTLDLHGNITQAMLDNATVLIGYDKNPHVDLAERGREAAQVMAGCLGGALKPVMRHKRVPLLCPVFNTAAEPMLSRYERLHRWEEEPGAICASLFHGFFRSDIAEASMSVVAVTDNDPELGQRIVDDMAEEIMRNREQFTKNMPTVEEAVQRAMAAKEFPVVLADVSDNPGGGSTGDGTYLLAALAAAKAKSVCYAVMVDPESAAQAAKAGAGAYIDVSLGGKCEPVNGPSLQTRAKVISISDGVFYNKGPMWHGVKMEAGLTAVLDLDGIEVLVCSNRLQPTDPELFRVNGIEPLERKVIVVKSAQHFKAGYLPIAKEILEVDAPGLASQHPRNFAFKNILRPVFPLDKEGW